LGFCGVFFAALAFELRALGLLAGALALEPNPSPFCFSYFRIRSYIYAQAGLDYNPIYASHVAGITIMYHQDQLLVEMGVLLTFLSGLAFSHDHPNVYLSST
jgi:hypothetical protein